MKKYTFIVFLMLFIALNSFITYAAPIWSNPTNTTPQNYNLSVYSIFNVTWLNSTNTTNISQVNISANFSGSEQNYTINLTSGDAYNGTYGFQEILGAGTYQWKSCAIDNESSIENCTGYYNFTISKGNISSYLNILINGSASNETILFSSNANISAFSNALGDSDLTYTLWRNDTPLITGNNTWNASSLSVGTWKFFYNATNGANWSSGTTNSLYLFVTDLNFSGNNATPSSGATYSPSATYNFSINLTGSISNILFEANFLNSTHNYTTNNSTTYNNITINNSSSTYWITFPALAAGSYSYRWIANDTNNTPISSQASYVINQFTISPSLTEGGNGPPWTEASSTSVTLACTSAYPVNLTISPCGSQTGSGNSVSCVVSTGTGTSSAAYTCYVSSAVNYTGTITGVLNWGPSTLPSTSSSSSSSSSSQSSSGSFIITPSNPSVTIEPGSNSSIAINFSNAFSDDIMNINVSVSGIDSSWYSLDKTSISKLTHNIGTDLVNLNLNVPENATNNTYSIVFSAVGYDPFSGSTVTQQTTITLVVPQVTLNTTGASNATVNETNQTNQTTSSLIDFIANSRDFRNIILFIGFVAAGLVFIFRDNITSFLTKGKTGKHEAHVEHAHPEQHAAQKKASFLSSLKSKFSKLNEHKIVIKVKKEEKKKDKD